MFARELEYAQASARQGVEFIAVGPDSVVSRLGDKVVKEYQGMPIELLLAYKSVTNVLTSMLADRPHTGHLVIAGEDRNYRLFGNPVLAVSTKDSKAISPYIKGFNIQDFIWPDNREAMQKTVRDLDSDPERRFFQRLVDEILGGAEVFDVQALHQHLEDFSRRLNKDSGLTGIRVVPPNVKMRFDGQNDEIQLVVTDFCANIPSLKPARGEWVVGK